MPIANETFTRRQALGGIGLGAAALALPSCAALSSTAPLPASDPHAQLDRIAWNLLRHEPERATSLGVDTGRHAALRGKLKDLSPEGLEALATTLRADLA